jgi:hypothetical protein
LQRDADHGAGVNQIRIGRHSMAPVPAQAHNGEGDLKRGESEILFPPPAKRRGGSANIAIAI